MDEETAATLAIGQGSEEFFLHELVGRIYKELLPGYKRFASENEYPSGDRVNVFL